MGETASCLMQTGSGATGAGRPCRPRIVSASRLFLWAYVDQGISYLPFLERCRLIVVGAGHVGQRVAARAEVDFEVGRGRSRRVLQ
jgi:hypothetical protein